MRTRLELQAKLEGILGSRNVYFQPASNTSIKYPCIVYKLNTIDSKFADNKRYIKDAKYTITHIYQRYSNNLQSVFLDSFDYIEMGTPTCIDGLYHDVYTLYF